jgi:hypothetical protein
MEIEVDPELFDKVTSQPIDKVKYFSLHDDQSVSFTDVKGEYYVYGPIEGVHLIVLILMPSIPKQVIKL